MFPGSCKLSENAIFTRLPNEFHTVMVKSLLGQTSLKTSGCSKSGPIDSDMDATLPVRYPVFVTYQGFNISGVAMLIHDHDVNLSSDHALWLISSVLPSLVATGH